MKYTAANWLIDLLRKKALAMPELRILIRQTSNWTLPDKDIPQDSTMALFMLVYRIYYLISDRSVGYGVNQPQANPMIGDGHAAWSIPDDVPVLYDISEGEMSYA